MTDKDTTIYWSDLDWKVKLGLIGGYIALLSFAYGFMLGLLTPTPG